MFYVHARHGIHATILGLIWTGCPWESKNLVSKKDHTTLFENWDYPGFQVDSCIKKCVTVTYKIEESMITNFFNLQFCIVCHVPSIHDRQTKV